MKKNSKVYTHTNRSGNVLQEFNEIKTPEDWITNVLSITEKIEKGDENIPTEIFNRSHNIYLSRNKKYKRILIAFSVFFITIISTVGVTATILPTFRQWLLSGLGFSSNEIKENIFFEKELQAAPFRMEEDFIIVNPDEIDQMIYQISQEPLGIVESETRFCSGKAKYNGKEFPFSFEYVKNNHQVYGYNYTGCAYELKTFNGSHPYEAVLVINIEDQFIECWKINLETGELSSLTNRDRAEELYGQKAIWSIDTADGIEYREAMKKFSIDLKFSEDGSFLLFRSNRDDLPPAKETKSPNELSKDTKASHWFLRDMKTGDETRLDFIPYYLHNDDLFFVDNEYLAVTMSDESGDFVPILYDLTTNTTIKLESVTGSDNRGTFIFTTALAPNLEFRNILKDKKYMIPLNDKEEVSASVIDNNYILLYLSTMAIKIYMIEHDKLLTFERNLFSEQLDNMFILQNHFLLCQTIENNGMYKFYLVDLRELEKNE